MADIYLGPTVVEASEDRLRQNARKIQELQEEQGYLRERIRKYQGSTMLEAERIATEADGFLSPIPTSDEHERRMYSLEQAVLSGQSDGGL